MLGAPETKKPTQKSAFLLARDLALGEREHSLGWAQKICCPSHAFRSRNSFGGEEEDRTPDLRIANATLSQLSYPPNVKQF